MSAETPHLLPTAGVQLPLFPLNTVLFPGGPLALRIFETRYIDMVGRCMREGQTFGVVLSRDGTEVGAVGETAETGTTARIVDFSSMPDGLLGIFCVGEGKFRVQRRWQQADGLNLGEVTFLPAEAELGLPPEFEHLGELLAKVLPELGEVYTRIPGSFEDASWVGFRLAEILPIEMSEKLGLLELEDPIERLRRVSPLIRRVSITN